MRIGSVSNVYNQNYSLRRQSQGVQPSFGVSAKKVTKAVEKVADEQITLEQLADLTQKYVRMHKKKSAALIKLEASMTPGQNSAFDKEIDDYILSLANKAK